MGKPHDLNLTGASRPVAASARVVAPKRAPWRLPVIAASVGAIPGLIWIAIQYSERPGASTGDSGFFLPIGILFLALNVFSFRPYLEFAARFNVLARIGRNATRKSIGPEVLGDLTTFGRCEHAMFAGFSIIMGLASLLGVI